MILLERVGLLLGLAVSVGTVITVTVPALRNKLKKRLFQNEEQNEKIKHIAELLEELLAKERARRQEDEIRQEVELCVLRDLITSLYYRRLEGKKIHIHELEDVSALHDLYRRRGGNSYVQGLYEQMMGEWEVIG